MEWAWTPIERDCPGCGICTDVCLHDAIAMTREMAYLEPVPSACVGCMICVSECPFNAIEVNATSSAANGSMTAEQREALRRALG